jgi:ABC-type cobalamin transport system ATPase subunit
MQSHGGSDGDERTRRAPESALDRAMDVELGRIVSAESGPEWQQKVLAGSTSGFTVAVGPDAKEELADAESDLERSRNAARNESES